MHDDGGSGYIVDEEHQHTKKKTVPVVFHWVYGGKEVYLAGSFNNWTKVPMTFRLLVYCIFKCNKKCLSLVSFCKFNPKNLHITKKAFTLKLLILPFLVVENLLLLLNCQVEHMSLNTL